MFELKENDKGYLVYRNKLNNAIQNDNPEYLRLLTRISDNFCFVKYATYRCASKFHSLQGAFYTNCIPFVLVSSILDKHRLNQIDDSPLVRPTQLTALIHDVYYAAYKMGYFNELNVNVNNLTGILSNFFWNIFDPKRCTPISILELKQTFLLICDTISFEEIIYELYTLTADHNNCVSRIRFESMLQVLSKIFSYIDEQNDHFRYNFVKDIVHECFENTPGLVGLNQYQFNCLWKTESKFSYFANMLALIKRMKDAEYVLHSYQCVCCQITPIQGLRFKCQRCKDISLCLTCFNKGFTSNKHLITHRMYEISTNVAPPNKFKDLLTKCCTIFNKTAIGSLKTATVATTGDDVIESKLIENDNSAELLEICENDTKFVSTLGTFKGNIGTISKGDKIFNNSDKCSQMNFFASQHILDSIFKTINLLSEEHDLFTSHLSKMHKLKTDNATNVEYLEKHAKILDEQIESLRSLWKKSVGESLPHSSTPYKNHTKKRTLNISSPIGASIHGNEVNKTYLEQNKSDLSIRDISSWLQTKQSFYDEQHMRLKQDALSWNHSIDTQMNNFKELLQKVKDIVDDSYSDNTELAKTTQQLESMLDHIILAEEKKRSH